MRSFPVVTITLIILLVSGFSGKATGRSTNTWYVDDDNTSGPWNGTPEFPFQYIADGVAAAGSGSPPGDTVMVAGGTYRENINISKNITVKSSGGSHVTIVDGQCMGSVFTLTGGFEIVLTGFTITNGCQSNGGGIYGDAHAVITDNRIIDNLASNSGGGIYCVGNTFLIRNNVIESNTAPTGAGLYCGLGSVVTVASGEIGYNKSQEGAAGMHASGYAELNVVNNYIHDNHNTGTDGEGGGLFVEAGMSLIANNLVVRNKALGTNGRAGGIGCRNIGDIKVYQNTIANNEVTDLGGGVYIDNCSITMNDNIIWDNLAETGLQIYYVQSKNTTCKGGSIDYSDIEDLTGSGIADPGHNLIINIENVLSEDPLFMKGPLPNGFGDYYVWKGPNTKSPCIDKGSADADDVVIDTGTKILKMSELTITTDHIPDDHKLDMGFHYNSAILVPKYFPTIQDAIHAVHGTADDPPATIRVSDGTYHEQIVFGERPIILVSENGAQATFIDAGSPVTHSGSGMAGEKAWISGTKVNAQGIGQGLNHLIPKPRCVIFIKGNVGSKIKGFTVKGGQRGILCTQSSRIEISHNIIIMNANPFDEGSGLVIDYSPGMRIINNVIAYNSSEGDGGGIWCGNSDIHIINCSIFENESHAKGGGIFFEHSVDSEVRNSIVWANTANEEPCIHLDDVNPESQISYCDLPIFRGEGNIHLDPEFEITPQGFFSYHLTYGSPCINMGDKFLVDWIFDLDGEPRKDLQVDIGADEVPIKLGPYQWDKIHSGFDQHISNSAVRSERTTGH